MLQRLPSIVALSVLCALGIRYIWVGWRVLRPGGGRLPACEKRWELARARWRLDGLGRRVHEEWLDSREGARHVGRELLIAGLVMAVAGLVGLVDEIWPLFQRSG